MQRLTRRGFGQGMGAALALVGLAGRTAAHEGIHQVSVRISRFAFDPALVEIFAGDTVTWTNADPAPHTATAEDGAWDTGELTRGDNGGITFDRPGEYAYACAFHPHMKGKVIVRPGPHE